MSSQLHESAELTAEMRAAIRRFLAFRPGDVPKVGRREALRAELAALSTRLADCEAVLRTVDGAAPVRFLAIGDDRFVPTKLSNAAE